MKLSIITVSFNTQKLLKQTLSAVYDSKFPQGKLEVFVVDNNSQDGSVGMVKKQFPKAKLIQNKDNLGFAKANNQAIKKAKGEYILLLNSDTKLYPDSLQKLIDFMDSHPKAGVASGQLLYTNKQIQPHGGYLPHLTNVAAWMLFIDDIPIVRRSFPAYQHTAKSFYKHPRQLGWVQGACMIIRSRLISKIGPLDDNIFMYGEDIDFCQRAQKAGWQVWNVPDANVIHYQFASSKGISENALLGEYKGIKYIFKKHKPKWQIPILRILLKLGASLRILVFGTILKDKE